MAGGTYVTYNKNRPGAYINFKAIPKPLSNVGSRGVATMPMTMDWGPVGEVMEIYSEDLITGKAQSKIGYTVYDDEVQMFREVLKGCYKLLAFRVDTGGKQASATLGNLTVTAKYTGICGNKISVAILDDETAEEDTNFIVVTYYNTLEKDRQNVTSISELVDNDWVNFSGTGALSLTTGTMLSGGENGTVINDTYSTYMNTMKMHQWQVMGLPITENSNVRTNTVTYIKNLRENIGKKVQLVLYDYSEADYEAIISVDQGYKTSSETIGTAAFVATITGLTAGAEINESLTYYVIDGATEIINQRDDEQIETAITTGKMVLSTRQDGVIVIEKDINTLHNFTIDKDYQFSKNRVIRTLDEIANSSQLTWEKSYIGKVDNDEQGRKDYKADLIYYFNELQRMRAIQNFDSTEDIDVLPGNEVDEVIVKLIIQPVDSMEKMYMTVMVGQKTSGYTVSSIAA